MSVDKASLLAALENVLAPLPKETRTTLLDLAGTYLDSYPPVQWVCSRRERGIDSEDQDDEPPLIWELGSPSPLNPTFTVFALFHWVEERCVIALSFSARLEEGSPEASTEYRREVIFDPRFLSGPMSLSALALELHYHLSPDSDDEPE
jgi:hypothetical protein